MVEINVSFKFYMESKISKNSQENFKEESNGRIYVNSYQDYTNTKTMSLYHPRNWLNPNICNRAGQWLVSVEKQIWKCRPVLYAPRRPKVWKENREGA